MVIEFKTGEYYRYTSILFKGFCSDIKEMRDMYDGKPHLCIFGKNNHAKFKNQKIYICLGFKRMGGYIMVIEFIKGEEYKLKKDRHTQFLSDVNNWMKLFLDGEPRECIETRANYSNGRMGVKFEGIEDGFWSYAYDDFEII